MNISEVVLQTPRLTLRHWRDEDAEPFAAMNADPLVMTYLGGPASRWTSDQLMAKFGAQLASEPFGRWAVEARDSGGLIGFLGLGHHPVAPEAPEIGWRLVPSRWGQGLATEGAKAVRDYAFGQLGLDLIVSVADPANTASIGVMGRIGMRHSADREYDGKPVVVWSLDRRLTPTAGAPARRDAGRG